MTDLVPPEDIERIVGAPRDRIMHLARAVSSEEKVYLLHSQACLDRGGDLRDCEHSKALDGGIDPAEWERFEDVPVVAVIRKDRLAPLFGPRSGMVPWPKPE